MNFSRDQVTSADGTPIGFLRTGTGPGIVLVQGAGADAWRYRDLAVALSPDFTVFAPDRRGRGMSPKPYSPDHDIARDVEDVDAVLTAAGAGAVFGLSSGAMITLEAARTSSRITRAAVFEPPFLPGGLPRDGVRRLGSEIDRGDLASALVTALALSGTAPGFPQRLPRPLTRLAAAGLIAVDERLPGPQAKQRDLIPGLRYDFHDVSSRDTAISTFGTIEQPMLLLSGSKSPQYLRDGVRTLATLLRDARHLELHGVSHDGPWNRSGGGHPREVADALRDFFTQ